jgi:hypothetical protein
MEMLRSAGHVKITPSFWATAVLPPRGAEAPARRETAGAPMNKIFRGPIAGALHSSSTAPASARGSIAPPRARCGLDRYLAERVVAESAFSSFRKAAYDRLAAARTCRAGWRIGRFFVPWGGRIGVSVRQVTLRIQPACHASGGCAAAPRDRMAHYFTASRKSRVSTTASPVTPICEIPNSDSCNR